jgi:hypothetical protein
MKRTLVLALVTIVACLAISPMSGEGARFIVYKTYTTIDSLAKDGTRAAGEMANIDVRVVSFENYELSARAMDAAGMEWTLRLRAPRLTTSQSDLLKNTDQAHVTFLVSNVLPMQHLIEGTLYNVTAAHHA